MEYAERMARRRRRGCILKVTAAVLAVLLAAAVGFLWWLKDRNDDRLTVTRYEVTTEKLSNPWKIALLTDLHNHEFGEHNSRLVEAVAEYGPDVILMCGDMVLKNDPDVSVVAELCEQLSSVADIYYVYGNHEGSLEYDVNGPRVAVDKYLLNRGVTVCYRGTYRIEKEGEAIELLSLSVQNEAYERNLAYAAAAEEFCEKDGFKLIASHYPDLFYKGLRDMDFDLGVAGHYHGGQVILPGVGGLYHTDTGPFPPYYGGLYQLTRAQLIVSRGLGNDTVFPRINNDPELVFIDVKPENQ